MSRDQRPAELSGGEILEIKGLLGISNGFIHSEIVDGGRAGPFHQNFSIHPEKKRFQQHLVCCPRKKQQKSGGRRGRKMVANNKRGASSSSAREVCRSAAGDRPLQFALE
ncbi:hypothetical protein niasHT_034024 [Heterodera trifolii]|uniref:Uncharacterized protein n=1 Tax=Heterodera trifolii TaxID=157864 RepID=A0ABD2I954_9BILA